VLTYQTFFENENIVAHEVLSPTGNLTEAASQLYNALHKLDQLHLDVIIAERFPDYGLGRTLMTASKGQQQNKITLKTAINPL
jgi:L-threonylcarbamoyladenylate synthase